MNTNSALPPVIERVLGFDAPFLKEHACREGIVQERDYDDAFIELKKYLYLCSTSKETLAMLDERLDALWHEFILFTREYQEFCSNYLGRFIHHRPNTSLTPTTLRSAVAFRRRYVTTFGSIPEVWVMPPLAIRVVKNDTMESQLAGKNCGGQECGGCCDNT